jgi:hypothetical protein
MKARTTWEPMYPAPPVTNQVISHTPLAASA